jgi:type II secretory pathway predicted ATPase ExeA
MPKWFNIAGPCQSDIHYMLPPLARLPDLERLVAQRSYFVIHAPRQTGKTTAMLALAQQLIASGQYTAIVVSSELGAAFPHDPGVAEKAMLGEWRKQAQARLSPELQPPAWPKSEPGSRIVAALGSWAQTSPRPLVVLIDEIDALQDETLISVLRQLRSGYPSRPQAFPQSIALIGVRHVRSHGVISDSTGRLHAVNHFNIKSKSLTLQNFTCSEVTRLYQQHTTETGQVFYPEAIQRVFDLTQGHPRLVNALAKEVVEELVPDTTKPITVEYIEQAKEILIQRKNIHINIDWSTAVAP